ncbi:MAG: NADH-quinone oxidoreductase subunit NuoF [Candidatus Eisenbacteria bacterium]|nr:NADH-quinone oxidoreductase subunit NuoF [Candidatus Eisenbacteria bacterium]
MEKILLKNIEARNAASVDGYLSLGGYGALKKVLKELSQRDVIEAVKTSGLRGRGGAGFPTGLKWDFVPKDFTGPKYVVCNADEGEPGTFKDRAIIEKDPHALIEGIGIACYAIGARSAFIYIRGEFARGFRVLEKAIAEARGKGILGEKTFGSDFGFDIMVHRGAGAYICGEETALLDSIEGRRGNPRLKPPFPATEGLYGKPTVINNVETIACLPHIILRGPSWFSSIGTEKNTGPKLFCLSGHVNRPGLYELPMGTRLREIVFENGGGTKKGRKLKAVIPGGSSTPVLDSTEADVQMDFESLAKVGSMLGSAGIIVMDDTTCMVRALHVISRFYHHESCGQCSPCREGTGWLERVTGRIEDGDGREGDIDLLLDISDNIKAKTVCPFGDAAILPVESFVTKFREEFEAHLKQRSCPFGARFERTF